MTYQIQDGKICFPQFYDLQNGYIADFGKTLIFDYPSPSSFLILADLRATDNPDLNILPAQLVRPEMDELIVSYRLNFIVLGELLI